MACCVILRSVGPSGYKQVSRQLRRRLEIVVLLPLKQGGPTLRVASSIKPPTSFDLPLDVFITYRHAVMTTNRNKNRERLGAIPTADAGIEGEMLETCRNYHIVCSGLEGVADHIAVRHNHEGEAVSPRAGSAELCSLCAQMKK